MVAKTVERQLKQIGVTPDVHNGQMVNVPAGHLREICEKIYQLGVKDGIILDKVASSE